jgi:hypothetical protein
MAFTNDIAFHGGYGWENRTMRPMHFYGTVSEFNGSRKFLTSGNGGLHFHGPLNLTGRIWHEGGHNFHNIEAVEGTLGVYKHNFLGGNTRFHLPSNKDEYEYDVSSNIGMAGGFNANVRPGVTLLTRAPIMGPNFSLAGDRERSIWELLAPTNNATSTLSLNGGLLILKGELTGGGQIHVSEGSIDLDGQDLLGWNLRAFIDQACF